MGGRDSTFSYVNEVNIARPYHKETSLGPRFLAKGHLGRKVGGLEISREGKVRRSAAPRQSPSVEDSTFGVKSEDNDDDPGNGLVWRWLQSKFWGKIQGLGKPRALLVPIRTNQTCSRDSVNGTTMRHVGGKSDLTTGG